MYHQFRLVQNSTRARPSGPLLLHILGTICTMNA